MASKNARPAEMAFEEAMEKLESIVEGMESEKLPLDGLIAGYEEGTKLLKLCQRRIADAQKRIEIIARGAGEENFSLKHFDPEGGGEAQGEEKEEEPETEEELETEEEPEEEEEKSDEIRLL